MKFFIKVNFVSLLYALLFFVEFELVINVYRISILTHLELGTVNNIIISIGILFFITFTISILILIRKWMGNRKSIFWSVLLWVPYLAVFICVFSYLLPFKNPENAPSSAAGLIIIGMIIVYPVYIAMVNLFGLGLHKYL